LLQHNSCNPIWWDADYAFRTDAWSDGDVVDVNNTANANENATLTSSASKSASASASKGSSAKAARLAQRAAAKAALAATDGDELVLRAQVFDRNKIRKNGKFNGLTRTSLSPSQSLLFFDRNKIRKNGKCNHACRFLRHDHYLHMISAGSSVVSIFPCLALHSQEW
jgi:hypothetical protein